MGLVRENISLTFQRGSSEEEIKSYLFGLRVGQIVVPKNTPFPKINIPAFLIERISDLGDNFIDKTITLLGIGNFFNLNYRNPGDTPDQWFNFSIGFYESLGDEEDYKPIDINQKELILKCLKDKKQKEYWETHKKNFEERSGGKKALLKESINFHRISSEGGKKEIIGKLLGWRPGQILISKDDIAGNLLKIWVYVGEAEDEWSHNKEWTKRCLKIGHIAGNPKYAHIHFKTEFIGIKKEEDLRFPNTEEKKAIEKSLKNKNYQKYISIAERLVEAKVFV